MKKYHFPFIDLDKEEEWINKYIRQGWRLRRIHPDFAMNLSPKKRDRHHNPERYGLIKTHFWSDVTFAVLISIRNTRII